MYLLLTVLTFVVMAATLPPHVTALIAASTLVVTWVGQKTVELLTGVVSPAGEVLRSVGLGLLCMGLLWTNVLSFNVHFDGSMKIQLGWSFFLAYALGFTLGMRISFFQACVVAAVTTALSVLLFVLLMPVWIAYLA